MPYTKTTWVAGTAPGISAANLNHLETQYDEANADLAAKMNATTGHKHTGEVNDSPKLPLTSLDTDVATQVELDTAIATAIPKSLIDAKGDLIIGSAADTPARLAVGSNGQVPVADSAQAVGIKWADGIKFAFGTYTGDGAAEAREIAVGFRPSLLIVGFTGRFGDQANVANGCYMGVRRTSDNNAVGGITSVTYYVLLGTTASGFQVTNNIGNYGGTNYYWAAVA